MKELIVNSESLKIQNQGYTNIINYNVTLKNILGIYRVVMVVIRVTMTDRRKHKQEIK